jgi:hypothetical protein
MDVTRPFYIQTLLVRLPQQNISKTDIYVLTFLDTESPMLGCQHGQVLVRPVFLTWRQLLSHCVLTGQKEWVRSLDSPLRKALIPSWGPTLMTLSKSNFQILSHCGLRALCFVPLSWLWDPRHLSSPFTSLHSSISLFTTVITSQEIFSWPDQSLPLFICKLCNYNSLCFLSFLNSYSSFKILLIAQLLASNTIFQ